MYIFRIIQNLCIAISTNNSYNIIEVEFKNHTHLIVFTGEKSLLLEKGGLHLWILLQYCGKTAIK